MSNLSSLKKAFPVVASLLAATPAFAQNECADCYEGEAHVDVSTMAPLPSEVKKLSDGNIFNCLAASLKKNNGTAPIVNSGLLCSLTDMPESFSASVTVNPAKSNTRNVVDQPSFSISDVKIVFVGNFGFKATANGTVSSNDVTGLNTNTYKVQYTATKADQSGAAIKVALAEAEMQTCGPGPDAGCGGSSIRFINEIEPEDRKIINGIEAAAKKTFAILLSEKISPR